MKVLVTGGAGFVGSHLVDRLLARKDRVLVIDNYATGRRDNLTSHPNLTIVEGTIADRGLVERAFAEFGPEQVVHAAASYKDPDNWTEDSLTNVVGTANVVQASKAARVRRLIYFQTALCYGLQPVEQPITLTHPLRPEGSSYAISKTAGEHYVQLGGLDWISFRLANAYGPRNLSGPLPTFYQRLSSDKPCFVMDTRRDFMFIDDLIEVVLRPWTVEGARAPTTSPPAPTCPSRSSSTPRSRRCRSSWIGRWRSGPETPTTPTPSCSIPRRPTRTLPGARPLRSRPGWPPPLTGTSDSGSTRPSPT